MKYLLLIAVLVVGACVLFFRRADRKAAPPGSKRAQRGAGGGAPPTMLACSHCGVHLPRDEALEGSDGQAYCSEAHRVAGPRQGR
jgi:uncharacterized protein